MAAPPLPAEQALFDEAGYLRLYPEIAEAVGAGAEVSGWAHYRRNGRTEGRQPNDVDAAFYLQAYPQAAADIAAGRAEGAAAHYLRFGRARGYRPNAAAPAVAGLSALWTDLPHAADIIEGRLELGYLTERQAALLRRWVTDGFVVVDDAFDPRVLAAAALDLERAFAGACPDLLFSCGAVALGPAGWQPEINPYPAAALDLHFMSHAVRSVLFAEPIAEMLGLLFDAPALLTHSRGVLRDTAQGPQRDGDAAGFTLAGGSATALVALEDMAAGALLCFPGSHRLPAEPACTPEAQMAEHGPAAQAVAGKRGQALLRHPRLVHAAEPVPEGGTRRALLAQYCPRYAAPRYAERLPSALRPFGAHRFTSQYYRAIDPLD